MLRSFIIEVFNATGDKTDTWRVTLGDPLKLAVEHLHKDAAGDDSWQPAPQTTSTGTLCAMVMHWMLGRPLSSITRSQLIGSIKVLGDGKMEHIFA